MWDNRARKTNPRAPDFKCRTPDCTGRIWPGQIAAETESDASTADGGATVGAIAAYPSGTLSAALPARLRLCRSSSFTTKP